MRTEATVISAKRRFQGTIKVRIANELPNVPIGLVRLLGKVLVSPEDKVGFTMYDFTLQPEDDFSFTAIYPDQNHIYYCVEGTLLSIREYSQQSVITKTAFHSSWDCLL